MEGRDPSAVDAETARLGGSAGPEAEFAVESVQLLHPTLHLADGATALATGRGSRRHGTSSAEGSAAGAETAQVGRRSALVAVGRDRTVGACPYGLAMAGGCTAAEHEEMEWI